MLQTEDDLLHGQTPLADPTRGVEQDEASHQAQDQMPIVGVFTADLTRLSRQQMLQGPKHKFNPGPPSPPPEQLRGTQRGLQTQQIEAILARLIHDDNGHWTIRWTRRPQPHIGDACLPWGLAPGPPLAVDQVVPFDLLAI